MTVPSATLADLGERLRHSVEREGSVDVDAKVAGDTQLGRGLEVSRPLPNSEYPQSAPGEPAENGSPDADPAAEQGRVGGTRCRS